jgi:hypothetical protein
MATEKQLEALKKLSSQGENIPGLNKDKIIENLIKKDPTIKKYFEKIDAARDENIERGMSKEEAEEKVKEIKKKALDDIKKNLTAQVEEDITKIKQEFKSVKDSISSMGEDIASFITAKSLPAVITVPPGAPNPATVLIEILQKKKDFEKVLNVALVSLTAVITIANRLKFELPDSVLTLVGVLGTVRAVISTPLPDNLIPPPEPEAQA